MKVLLLTTGSRGDVQPFLALARGLTEAGHEATVAAPRRFAALSAEVGAEFVGLDDSLFVLQDELVGAGTWAAVTAASRARPYLQRWLDDLASLAGTRADVVVFTQKTLGGASIAEKLGVPAIPAQLIPTVPATSAFASPLAPARTPRALARLTWSLSDAVERPWRGMVARWRAERLGLASRAPRFASLVAAGGILSAWSPHLLPAPSDWPASAAPLGFWTVPAAQDWHASPALEAFLDDGPPPVLVGFGSMTHRDPAALAAEVVAGLRRAGRRGLIVSGWAGLGATSAAEDIHVVDAVPFASVLPRVAAIVHHGGVGTVAAAMRAGVPQVVHPFFGDQPFWARRLHELGVAPPALSSLTADGLAASLAQVDALVPAARRIRAALAGEDGVAAARARIEAAVGGHG